MKLFFYIVFLFAVSLLCISCEEITQLDLHSSEPQLVIDASIKENGPCLVVLTKTQDFYDNTPYQKVSNAEIILRDQDGNEELLTESSHKSGFYISQMLGSANREYTLKVHVEDKSYEAKSIIPPVVEIDSLYIYNIRVGKEDWYSPCIIFQDPPQVQNYYYCNVFINDNLLKKIYLNDDEHRNGLEVHRILYYNKEENKDEEIKEGDVVRVEMQSIDKGAYTYYNSLSSVGGGSPANPLTNFSGNALGCFKAYTISSIERTIGAEHIYTPNK